MTDSKASTFRVRGVPHSVTLSTFASFLETCISDLGGEENVLARSLAPSPDVWTKPPTQTGTIEFQQLPKYFQERPGTSWSVKIPNTSENLVIDSDFLGFTVLNNVSPSDHHYDCIAITGLSGHAFGSWRSKSSQVPQYMWLRDQLPKDFPHVRVITYGYDSKLIESQSFQSTDDLAQSFIQQLETIGRAENSAKPCILLAHSLGGIITKRAFLYMANSGPAQGLMFKKIWALIFFGVPNKGMQIDSLTAMVKNQPNADLVHELSTNSSYLNILHERFSNIVKLNQIRVVSAYETKVSPTAKLTENGQWERKGTSQILVTRESASCASPHISDVFSINQSHSNMVKFADSDLNYNSVRQRIKNQLLDHRMHTDSENSHVTKSNSFRMHQQAGAEKVSENDASQTMSLKEFSKHICDCLSFPESTSRVDAIEKAESFTFGWIFDNRNLGFLDWIFGRRKFYWIRGKPGSGKSTMMKYLFLAPELRSSLNTSRHQIDLWFFFNERGTFLQKSHEGLLCTIILQILEKDSRFYPIIRSSSVGQMLETRKDLKGRETLNTILEVMLSQNQFDVEFILFLDALDEYHGLPDLVVMWMRDITCFAQNVASARTKVRICFSSRPWDAFLKAFDQEAGFALHEHTVDDIKEYTRSKLASKVSLDRFSGRISINDDRIISLIVDRAQGVFLWVRLAIDELQITGIPTTMTEMENFIGRLPAQLEEFYVQSLNRIPEHHRRRTFNILELVLRNTGFDALDVRELAEANACVNGETYQECSDMLEKTREKRETTKQLSEDLMNCCSGLIEFVGSRLRVQFIHLTVQEFVSRPGFARLVLGDRASIQIQNGFHFLFKHRFVQGDKGYIPEDEDLAYMLRARFQGQVLQMAHSAENSTGRPLSLFLDSIPQKALSDFYNLANPFDDRQFVSPFLLGVIGDLKLYVEWVIKNSLQVGELRQQKPLHALVLSLFYCQFPYRNFSGLSGMLQMLLSMGFDATDEQAGQTPFELLFCRQSLWWVLGPSLDVELDESAAIQIARILAEKSGQDPNTRLLNRDSQRMLSTVANRNMKSAAGWNAFAIHYAIGAGMTAELLRLGGNPNCLTSKNETPLDLCLTYSISLEELQIERMFLLVGKMSILLRSGGCFTKQSAKKLPAFQKLLKTFRVPIPDGLEPLPILSEEEMKVEIRRREEKEEERKRRENKRNEENQDQSGALPTTSKNSKSARLVTNIRSKISSKSLFNKKEV